MKIKHNGIELNASGNAFATGGSFLVDGKTYNGNWYEDTATDGAGNEYRVIWTDVNWDAADGADACDWNSPDYILNA
jgi:hypothetical protein